MCATRPRDRRGDGATTALGRALCPVVAHDPFDDSRGGAGADVLEGGEGSDWFFFFEGAGVDIIIDFRYGEDVIDVSAASGIGDFYQLSGLFEASGADTIIRFTADDSVTIVGISPYYLTADNFGGVTFDEGMAP